MWSRWLVLFALISAVSLYSIEATHDHKTLAEQLNCPAGHAVGHSPLNSFTPNITTTFVAYRFFKTDPPKVETVHIESPLYFIPQSHAPPFIFS